jgi:hypothetical protein
VTALDRVRHDLADANQTIKLVRGALEVARSTHERHDVQRRRQISDAHSTIEGLRRHNQRLACALAEAAHLLERCTPPRFRDRELAPTIAAYRALAGFDAVTADAAAADADRPTLGAPPPRGVLQSWECVIREVTTDDFIAEVHDPVDRTRPVDMATFSRDVVADEDQDLIQCGTVFFLLLGYRPGSTAPVTEIQFRPPARDEGAP